MENSAATREMSLCAGGLEERCTTQGEIGQQTIKLKLNVHLYPRYNCFPCDYNACVDCAMKEALLMRSRRGTLVARLAVTGIKRRDYKLFRSRTASRSCSRNTSRCPSVSQSRRNSRDLGRGALVLPEGHRRLIKGTVTRNIIILK